MQPSVAPARAMAPEPVDRPEPTGYLHPTYAASLAGFGRVEALPRSGAWLLLRTIPGSDAVDALAGYRNLYCSEWSGLAADLAEGHDAVSVTAVTEPHTPLTTSELRAIFPDLVRPYKDHFLVDLSDPRPSRNNRRRARKAMAAVDVSVHDHPVDLLDEWEELFDGLRRRHSISGIAAFSKAAFRQQLSTPGCVAFRARADGRSVSMVVCYVMDDVVHAHLAASDETGYRLAAAYALHGVMIEEFAGRGLRWLNLGSTAGMEADAADGLTVFKKGWASTTRPTYLCGRINDQASYARLVGAGAAPQVDFFPAYRAPARG